VIDDGDELDPCFNPVFCLGWSVDGGFDDPGVDHEDEVGFIGDQFRRSQGDCPPIRGEPFQETVSVIEGEGTGVFDLRSPVENELNPILG